MEAKQTKQLGEITFFVLKIVLFFNQKPPFENIAFKVFIALFLN